MNSQDASVQTFIAGIETPFLAEMDKVNLEACLASHAWSTTFRIVFPSWGGKIIRVRAFCAWWWWDIIVIPLAGLLPLGCWFPRGVCPSLTLIACKQDAAPKDASTPASWCSITLLRVGSYTFVHVYLQLKLNPALCCPFVFGQWGHYQAEGDADLYEA